MSLVALVAQAFSLSARLTALISLYVVAVIYTWLYRRWINARVSSAGAIAFTLTGVMAAFLLPPGMGLRGGDLSPAGILGYGERANDWAVPKVPEYARAAKDEVWYVGIDFHISSSQHQEMILKLLGEGVDVRFLIYDFLDEEALGINPNFDQLVRRFDCDGAQVIADLTSTVENLRRLQRRWTNKTSGAQLEIRLYRALPWARAYFFDPEQENGTALLVSYIYGQDAHNLPALLLRSHPKGLLPQYFKGAQALWRDSEDFTSWLTAYDAYKARNAVKTTGR
ncbi:MAG TPA: DUF5919 domain-containing protein [Thermoanaerobaculia bacterium]|nr:DUF5919 domain-containing protein [Thermoanaerobaculia bacterium]